MDCLSWLFFTFKMAPRFMLLRIFLSKFSSRSAKALRNSDTPIEVTKKRTSDLPQGGSTLNVDEPLEVDIRRLLSLFHISEVRKDLVTRYIAGEINPDVPIMSYRQARKEIDGKFEAMIRDRSEGAFQIRIIKDDLLSIGRQITAWSISRNDWNHWRGTPNYRILIQQYIRSGMTPLEAEVRVILFYLEFNEQAHTQETIGSKHDRVQPSSVCSLHRDYKSIYERFRVRSSKGTQVQGHLDATVIHEAHRRDRAMMPEE